MTTTMNTTIDNLSGNSYVQVCELTLDVQSALRSSPYSSGLRNVTARLVEGGVALSGRVATYYLKQMAQHLAKAELDGPRLVNKIRVVRPPKSRR